MHDCRMALIKFGLKALTVVAAILVIVLVAGQRSALSGVHNATNRIANLVHPGSEGDEQDGDAPSSQGDDQAGDSTKSGKQEP
jgi:hypothetical protein